MLGALAAKAPSSIKVLQTIARANRPMSRNDIARELRLKPVTVSHYLTVIENHINGSVGRILSSERIGRHKVWHLNENLKEAFLVE